MAIHSGSVLDGENPLSEHISLFILQLVIIVSLSRFLAIGLKYLNQPSVIAEVLGGILLGPTCLSRITVFKETVFPYDSLPRLKLVADIGLVLYLFLVGMELDPIKIGQQFKKSAAISMAGIVLPFFVGVGASKLIYDQYISKTVPFTSFFVFCGVAMSITAFPVLARILTERKLMATQVGQATIAAAASDDAVAWCLLILTVALINNPEKSINALFVFLIVIALGIFLWVAIRPIFLFMVKTSRADDGASQTNVFLVFTTMLTAAWFTQAIGVHAIFGAFLVGLITPHEKGFAIAMTEKMEDLVSILFLPLYFAYSGLNTKLTELNDGMSWLFVLLVLVVACGGKIIGCTAAARMAKMPWRESFAVGLLMNTKGLVEIIVLNLGLQGGLITDKVFAIFLVMALTTTFMTVPLISIVYPYSMYTQDYHLTSTSDDNEKVMESNDTINGQFSLLLCLPSMKVAPSMMQFLQMFHSSQKKMDMYCLRLMELGSRMSQVMMASESVNTMNSDPVLSVLRSFSTVNQIKVKTLLTVAQEGQFHSDVIEASDDLDVHFVIFPVNVIQNQKATPIPKWAFQTIEKLWNGAHCPVGFFVDRGFGKKRNADQVMLENLGKSVFFVMDGSQDSTETAVILNYLAYHEPTSVCIYTIGLESSPALDALKTFPNVTIESGTYDMKLISRSAKFTNRDVIMIGHELLYSDLSTSGYKFWLEHVCQCSVMVVKGVDERKVGESLGMKRVQSNRSLASLGKTASIV